jgi:hypothetical protein
MRADQRLRAKARLIAIALAVAFGFWSSSVALLSGQTPATEHHSWKVYTNVRFQYSICYPEDLLVPQGEAANSDGQKFLAKDGAQLIVFGQNNTLNESLKQVRAETASRLAGASGKITYQAITAGWFVVSGQKERSIFYSKTLYAHEQFKSFELTYNSGLSAIYKPLLTRLAGCFVNTQH